MRFRWTAALGSVVAAATVLIYSPAQAQPAVPNPVQPVPPVQWVDCGGGFQCGTVDVPLDYRRPAGDELGIGVIRLPATDPQQRIGSLLINPGGPGGSGVQFARQAARFIFSPQVRARFDIVGFDPRGVGTSGPLRCFLDAEEQREFWGDLPAVPRTIEEERRLIRRNAAYTRLCGERNAALLPHVSTVDVARDMDRIREAVGDRTLTYVGYSYGTYLGEVYANLFPDRVRALVLDGVIDPETWANRSALFPPEAAHGGELSLSAFATACAQAGEACPFANGDNGPRVRERLDAIMAGLRRAPLPAPNADPPGELDFQLGNAAYLISMYDTFFWPAFAAGLAQAEAGDGSLLLDFIRQFFAPPDVYDNSGDVFSAVFCTDGTMPRTPDLWPAFVRASEYVAPTFSRYWWYVTLPCATWPARAPERYAGPWNRPTAAPILMINTLADPATPLSGAVRAQRRMADARLLTVDGWGHTSLGHFSSCARQVMDQYLIGQVAPANGRHCPPDAGPFDSAIAARTEQADRPAIPWLPPLR
jgi:pimeloyl-ACP methyl ester carboxylesterase